MIRVVLFSILAAMALPLHALDAPKPVAATAGAAAAPVAISQTAAPGQGIAVSKDAPAPPPKDSIALRGKAIQDSIAAHSQALRDSLELRRKFVRDSLAIRSKSMRDSANARNRFVMDSTLAHRKALRDSSLARRKFVRDSTATHYKARQDSLAAHRAARMDSLKTAAGVAAAAKASSIAAARTRDSLLLARKAFRRDSLKQASVLAAAAKRSRDSLASALKTAKADSLKAARTLAAAVKRANDSVVAGQKAARADSLKGAGNRPPPPKDDSVSARTYRITDRPLNKEQIKYFQSQFGFKDPLKPESSDVVIRYRGKNGSSIAYVPGTSDIAYSNEGVPMLGEKDFLPDSLIHTKTDAILKNLLKEKADRYVFANFEITMVQKKIPDGDKGKVYPPVPAYYAGRYVRKLDDRVVLGDEFQIRIAYGEAGAISAFSFRDPVVAEGETIKVPSRARVLDSVMRWAKSRTRPRRLLYPYSPDSLYIRELKPVKVIETYVPAQRKFSDNSQLDGAYLLPTVTVLAEASLIPPKRKIRQPFSPEPMLLHFQFPCRPETGLCWPDGAQGMQCHGKGSERRSSLPGQREQDKRDKTAKPAAASPAAAPAAK